MPDNVEKLSNSDRLDFGGGAPNALAAVCVPGRESEEINCEGLSIIVLRVEYSGKNVVAPLRIVLISTDGMRIPTAKVTPANTGDSNGTYETGFFHGEAVIVSTLRAKSFRVVLADKPSNNGSVSVWASAVTG
jgi:hypothetical protein